MKELLTDKDGWYRIQDHPQQHYFFKSQSLCGLYLELPSDASHDNDPSLHCQKCRQKVNKLMAVASSIAGKKLNSRDVMNLLEMLEKIDLNKGNSVKVKHGENTVVVLGHSDGKKSTIEDGLKRKKDIVKK